jgi:hypothetical protein
VDGGGVGCRVNAGKINAAAGRPASRRGQRRTVARARGNASLPEA